MTDQEQPSQGGRIPRFQPEEMNSISHGIGLILSLAGACVLIGRALAQEDAWRVAGCTVFATTLVAVYAASTASHSFSEPRLRHCFRILDQGFIYLLIVGTYTPFALAYLRTGWWLLFLGVMWTIAIVGFFSKVLFSHRVEAVAIWIYVVLGWMPIVSTNALVSSVPSEALWWMLAGGLSYTVGTVFLFNDHKYPHFHLIWHLFVIGGSTCHFLAILLFVA